MADTDTGSFESPPESGGPRPRARPARGAVVLVHGLWARAWMMGLLARRLAAAGYDSYLFSYPSVRKTLSENAEELARFAAQIRAPSTHYVGHSLGGRVVYQALSRHPTTQPGHVVLLGCPFRASYAADQLGKSLAGRVALGWSVPEWPAGGIVRWNLQQKLGIIAGSLSLGMGRIIVPGLPQPNDGVVLVEETQVSGAREHVVLPVGHSFMLVSRRVAQKVIQFLHSGSFGAGNACKS